MLPILISSCIMADGNKPMVRLQDLALNQKVPHTYKSRRAKTYCVLALRLCFDATAPP